MPEMRNLEHMEFSVHVMTKKNFKKAIKTAICGTIFTLVFASISFAGNCNAESESFNDDLPTIERPVKPEPEKPEKPEPETEAPEQPEPETEAPEKPEQETEPEKEPETEPETEPDKPEIEETEPETKPEETEPETEAPEETKPETEAPTEEIPEVPETEEIPERPSHSHSSTGSGRGSRTIRNHSEASGPAMVVEEKKERIVYDDTEVVEVSEAAVALPKTADTTKAIPVCFITALAVLATTATVVANRKKAN